MGRGVKMSYSKEAQAKYNKKSQRFYAFKLHVDYDADLIEKLESQESKQAYIKSLIRNDIKKASE